jgi:hypothetical protein
MTKSGKTVADRIGMSVTLQLQGGELRRRMGFGRS